METIYKTQNISQKLITIKILLHLFVFPKENYYQTFGRYIFPVSMRNTHNY